MSREPLSRNPMRLADEMAASVLKRPSNMSELLMTTVPPENNLIISHIHGMFSGKIPLRTSTISSWPEKCSLQCLHCGGLCDVGPPIPAARHYDSQQDQFWVYGPFCRPCCALGYICETDSTSKQLSSTVELMRRYFSCNNFTIAPPRASHWRFGGPLNDSEFYSLSGYCTLNTLQPPFVTFANYVVGMHQRNSSSQEVSTLLPQSAGRLIDLQRPTFRTVPLAEKKPSGKAPLILEFLAKLTNLSDVKDKDESIQMKGSVPKKRKAAEPATEVPNFLKQYVKKNQAAAAAADSDMK